MTTQAVTTHVRASQEHGEPKVEHANGRLASIIRKFISLDNWLYGPPMTDRDRLNQALAETQAIRELGPIP